MASGGYGGGGAARLPGNQADGVALNNTQLVVPVGGQLTATSMIAQGASSAGRTAGWTEIQWFDALNALLQTDVGNKVDNGSGGAWHPSTITATAPASAAYARAAIHLTSDAGHNDQILGDNLSVSGATAGLPEGLVYRAVQAESGTSGSSEPAWPGILGQQVIDNEVIWEAVTTSRVTWTASPRYVSGTTEPLWPEDIGAMVQDGTINWRAVSRRVEDEKCPRTKVVAIVASKVFAVDKDIVRYSATANPLDWSSADDAGYLPTGLQQANANDMAVLAQYRANLVALNASSFQNWQVDPDPASMAILDQMDGVGSQWQKAAVPVANDLLYLSQLGVRSIGIANAAENLSAGDVGEPIDVMVQDAIRVAQANEADILGTYYPGAGQYWLAVGDYPPLALTIVGSISGTFAGDPVQGRYNAVGGVRPYRFSVVSGTFPPGLILNEETGEVTGILGTEGDYGWVIGVEDADGNSDSKPDSIVVSGYWNAADRAVDAFGSIQLSNSARDAAAVTTSPTIRRYAIRGTLPRSQGRRYVEFLCTNKDAQYFASCALARADVPLDLEFCGYNHVGTVAKAFTNQVAVGAVTTSIASTTVVQSTVIGIAVDLTTRRAWISFNGVFLSGSSPDSSPNGFLGVQTPEGPLYPWFGTGGSSSAQSNSVSLRLKKSEMQYFPVSASPFKAWGEE